MKKNTLLIVLIAGVAIYLFMMKKKKPCKCPVATKPAAIDNSVPITNASSYGGRNVSSMGEGYAYISDAGQGQTPKMGEGYAFSNHGGEPHEMGKSYADISTSPQGGQNMGEGYAYI